MTHCPNCHTKLVADGYNKNELVKLMVKQFIHTFTEYKDEHYCEKCVHDYYKIASDNYNEQQYEVDKIFKTYSDLIPLISIGSPFGWEYETIRFVKVTLFSDVVDVNGQRKLDESCYDAIRKEAIEAGGNAILGFNYAITAPYNVGDITPKFQIQLTLTGTIVDVSKGNLDANFEVARKNYLNILDQIKLLKKFSKI